MMVKYTRQEGQPFSLRCEACHLRPPSLGGAERLYLKFLMFGPVTLYARVSSTANVRGIEFAPLYEGKQQAEWPHGHGCLFLVCSSGVFVSQ
jgi:hypothetical protein